MTAPVRQSKLLVTEMKPAALVTTLACAHYSLTCYSDILEH